MATWYFVSQTVTDSFTTSLGCDSIVLTALTINNAVTTNVATTSCDSSRVNGTWYYTSQTVTDSFTTSLGCDSIVVTALTINYMTTTNLATTSCDSSRVNGTWYYTSQTVTDSFTTSLGCDSIVVYYITISNTLYSSEDLFGCESMVYKSATYTSSTQVIDSLVSAKGCDSIHAANLFITQPIIQKQKLTTCPGEEYELASGELISDSGIYFSTLISVSGCDSIIIEEIGYYDIKESLVPDIEKCVGDEVTFDISVWDSYEHIQWSTGEENTNILLDNFGLYAVNLTDKNGCIVRDTFRVIDAKCPHCPVYVPNAFTPNQSWINENFKPIHKCTFSEYKLQIYNRWGELIFETFDPEEFWDGVYLGKDVQQGVYVWILFYVDKKTKRAIPQRGTITLLR